MKRRRVDGGRAAPPSEPESDSSPAELEDDEYFEPPPSLAPQQGIQILLPKVVEPTADLSANLLRLHLLLQRQETEDNSVLFEELDSEAEPLQRLRDFENLAFRLAIDEGREMRRGRDLDILDVSEPDNAR